MSSETALNLKKIALLLPTLGGGGAERVTIELARELVGLGYAVEFVLMRAEGELLTEIPQGADVVDLAVPSIRDVFWPLRRYCREIRPVAVLAAMWPLTAVAIASIRSLGSDRPRIVAAEHVNFIAGTTDSLHSRVAMRTVGKWLYRAADGIVTVSDGVRDALSKITSFPASRMRTVYNPLPIPSEVAPIEDRELAEWWSNGGAKLLNIGRMMEQKDQATLLEAVKALDGQVDARLIILGEGPLRPDLEWRMNALGIADKVRLPGFRPDVHAYLRAADCFVLSSRWEGLPTVIIEAMMQGASIVSTNCPSGPDELLLEGKLGRLVPVGDASALADAIAATLVDKTDPAELKKSVARFNPRKAALAYLELLDPVGVKRLQA